MFFMSYCFTGGAYSLDTTPPSVENITTIIISNGAYDDLYLTKNINEPYSSDINNVWDYDTILHAKFQNNLSAGSAEFVVENTDLIRIRRRKHNSFQWITLSEKYINTTEDFIFDFFDHTARANVEYEYALVHVFGSTEGNYITDKITPSFRGVFISEQGEFFNTEIDVKILPLQQNKAISVIPTLGMQYPFVVGNGKSNYKSGTLSAVFVEPYEYNECMLDFPNAWEYRERLNNYLYNGKPKLLKYEDGRMWLIAISGSSIQETEGSHEMLVQTSFEWTEIGNCDDEATLYANGLLTRGAEMFEI